jgi:hypothetical protein
MRAANESAKCKQGEHDTRQGNREVASSEYHIERGFGPVNDGKILLGKGWGWIRLH